MKIVHGSRDLKHLTTGKKKVNKNIPNGEFLIKDSNVGGPLLVTELNQDSLDNSNQILIQTSSKQMEVNSFRDNSSLLEHEHLSLNVLLPESSKDLVHFNFDLNESDSEQVVCDLCLKSFQKIKLLIIHLAQHTGKYTCLMCCKVCIYCRINKLMMFPPYKYITSSVNINMIILF